MRFLFCSIGSPGFIYPMIGMAKALGERGHEVAFVVDQAWEEPLRRAGLMRLPRGDEDGGSFQIDLWARPVSIAIQVKHIEYALAQFRPDVLVAQSLTYGPLLVAERAGLPVGVLGLCTYLWPRVERWGVKRPGWPSIYGRRVWRHQDQLRVYNEARQLFRMPSVEMSPEFSPLLGDLFMVRSVPELEGRTGEHPERVHCVGACLWHSEEEPDGELAAWLENARSSGGSLVYVQHGNFFDQPGFWQALKEGLAEREDFWVLASSSRMDRFVGELPENFFVRPHIPQEHILSHACAVVAGGNTTVALGALTAGLPSLLIPGGNEQPDVAQLWSDAGVARTIACDEVTPELLLNEIGALIEEPCYKRKSQELARAFARYEGFSLAMDLLETLGATRKPVLRKQLAA